MCGACGVVHWHALLGGRWLAVLYEERGSGRVGRKLLYDMNALVKISCTLSAMRDHGTRGGGGYFKDDKSNKNHKSSSLQ